MSDYTGPWLIEGVILEGIPTFAPNVEQTFICAVFQVGILTDRDLLDKVID